MNNSLDQLSLYFFISQSSHLLLFHTFPFLSLLSLLFFFSSPAASLLTSFYNAATLTKPVREGYSSKTTFEFHTHARTLQEDRCRLWYLKSVASVLLTSEA